MSSDLWNGDRDLGRGVLQPRLLMLWLVTTHRAHRRRYLERLDRFEFVRLRSQREIEAWLASGTGG